MTKLLTIKLLALLFLLQGCAFSKPNNTIDHVYMAYRWAAVTTKQPVEWGDDNPNHEQLYDVIDECRNKTNYRTDRQVWGMQDYWATPNEYLAKGAGDCEDTAICSYYKLAKLGFKDINVVIGLDGVGSHSVAQVRTDNGLYILDSNSRLPIKAENFIGRSLTNIVKFGGKM